MTFREALAILEVKEDMDFSNIKKSYRDLADVWHPDRYTHNQRLYDKANEKFKEITCAYSIVQNHYKNTKNYHRSKDQTNTKRESKKQEKSENSNRNKDEKTWIIITCLNCGTKNRIPISNKNNANTRCGKCGKNPYLKKKKAKTNYENSSQNYQGQKKQSEKTPSYISVNCINCGTINRYLKSEAYSPSLKCSKCKNSPYRKIKTKSNTSSKKYKSSQFAEELDDIIKKNFESLKSDSKQDEPKKNTNAKSRDNKNDEKVYEETSYNNQYTNKTREIKSTFSLGSISLLIVVSVPIILSISVVVLIVTLVISE